MQKKIELYRGKAKTVYSTENPNYLIIEFRNDISAHNGLKIQTLDKKGMINNKINYFIMKELQKYGFMTHLEKIISDNAILVKKLKMIPIECVLRNRSAGSLVNRLKIQEGTMLNPPIFDLFLKDDANNDPIINESYCETFNLVSLKNLSHIRTITYEINKFLYTLFDNAGLILIDFKLEFGFFNDLIILGDEFSPDVSRIWDKITLKKLDKDIFRQNTGGLIESYENVAYRLGINLN
ncbi:MAG: phosphoribosylaminoimidazolesuccinocarboxamide synthase [Pantoea sp. Brub]|nr:phosphoribosylaminoimidazolesuccinocarboxamide synthase [Pantoea sp. Brub]